MEWYADEKWLKNYIHEEGNKFYFIVFMSFRLGLASDTTASIMRPLPDGLTEFVCRAVGNFSNRLSLAVTKDLGGK